MRPADQIKRLFKNSDVTVGSKVDERIINDALVRLEKLKKSESASAELSIWRIIMKSKMTKFAAAAVVIIAVILGLNIIGGPSTASIAFGEVLEYFQTFSYTFDLTVGTDTEKQGSAEFTMQAMVWELGRMRVDFSAVVVGKISSITDFNAGRTLLLFHQNKTGVIKKESLLNKNTGAEGIVAFCTKPIENLWYLLDGREERLGEKEIDGQYVTGFRVFQKDPYFEYDITIWADPESGVPSLVEEVARPLDESYPSIKWTMENFDLDVELDEGLFSLDLPTGYTLAYQEDLDKLEVKTQPSVEAEKIVQLLELWAEGRKNEAVEILLEINWTQPLEFGKEPYIFSVSEKAYKSLKVDDQKWVGEELSATMTTVREIALDVLDSGLTSVSVKRYEEAEKYFNAGLQLGKLLDHNPNSMVIVRLVGIAIEKKALNEMINLYTTTANQQKLQEAEKQLRSVEAEVDKIKKEAMGG